MIIKSASLLYLFDFDGTLVGTDEWNGWIRAMNLTFKKCYFNPSKLDIRWSILTARPRIDYLFVKTACRWHGLIPQDIYMSNTFLYSFKNRQEEMEYKHNFMKSILEDKLKLKNHSRKITKIFYIDNNPDATRILNSMRGQLNYLAFSVSDLYNQNFTSIII